MTELDLGCDGSLPDRFQRIVPRPRPPTLELDALPDRVGLRVRGQLDLQTRQQWQEALEQLTRRGCDLHLDLSGLTFASSSATAIMVSAAQRLVPRNRIVVSSPPYSMRRTLEMLYPTVAGIEVLP